MQLETFSLFHVSVRDLLECIDVSFHVLLGVNRVREEADGSVRHPVRLFAVELGVVDVSCLGIVERILGDAESVAFDVGASLYISGQRTL